MGSSRDISDEVNKKQVEDRDEAAVFKIICDNQSPNLGMRKAAKEIVEYFNVGPGSGYVNQD